MMHSKFFPWTSPLAFLQLTGIHWNGYSWNSVLLNGHTRRYFPKCTVLWRVYIHLSVYLLAQTKPQRGFFLWCIIFSVFAICWKITVYQRSKYDANRPLVSDRPFAWKHTVRNVNLFGKNLPQSHRCAVESWGTEMALSYIPMNQTLDVLHLVLIMIGRRSCRAPWSEEAFHIPTSTFWMLFSANTAHVLSYQRV